MLRFVVLVHSVIVRFLICGLPVFERQEGVAFLGASCYWPSICGGKWGFIKLPCLFWQKAPSRFGVRTALMADIVMAYAVMADIVMAYTVMALVMAPYSYGPYSYGTVWEDCTTETNRHSYYCGLTMLATGHIIVD